MKKIELQYFKKDTGKYYSSGYYETDKEHLFQIEEEVLKLKEENKLPGVSSNDWIIYINHGCPCLIL